MLREATYYDQVAIYQKLFTQSKNKQRFRKLIPLILAEDNLMLAYRMIKGNKGSKTAGVDKITIKQVSKMGRKEFVNKIRKSLENYKPTTIKRKYIPKKNGKLRPLGIPSIIERVIEQAIKQILEPIFEAKFYDHSYGFRPNRSQEHAIKICDSLICKGYTYVVDIDIESFFDNIDHSLLTKILWNNGIRDKKLLSIIKAMLKAPISGIGIPKKGAIQGGIISPLLANIYLNELDQWIDSQWRNCELPKSRKYNTNLKRGILVRFADDFKIFTRNRSEATRWFHGVTQWLKSRLRLNHSKEKSKIVNLKRKTSHFLGFELKARLSRNAKKTIGLTKIGKEEKNRIVKRLKSDYKSLAKLPLGRFKSNNHAAGIASYLRGIRNYFRIAHTVHRDLADVSHRTHRARDKLIRSPKFRSVLESIYRKVCHKDTIKTPNRPGKGINHLCPHYAISFKRPQIYKNEETYFKTVSIEIFRRDLNGIRNRIRTWDNITTEKADIILSLYTQQRGKDPITGLLLDTSSFECHRKNPKGKYVFKNCILVNTVTHYIIHGILDNMYRFCKLIKLNKKRREKLIRLWNMAHGI